MWFIFAGSQSCRDHIPDAGLFYKCKMQMASLYKQVKGVWLGLPSWGLKITTHPRLAVALHLYKLEQTVCCASSSPACPTPSNRSFCAGREGSTARAAFVF